MNNSTINNCKMIKLPKIQENRGNINIIEGKNNVPFDIRRIYYIYDVPKRSKRGRHAHKTLEQFLIPITGSFDIVLNDGTSRRTIKMNSLDYGLYIPSMIWKVLENFTPGSVCLVLVSEYFDKNDYIEIYSNFKSLK